MSDERNKTGVASVRKVRPTINMERKYSAGLEAREGAENKRRAATGGPTAGSLAESGSDEPPLQFGSSSLGLHKRRPMFHYGTLVHHTQSGGWHARAACGPTVQLGPRQEQAYRAPLLKHMSATWLLVRHVRWPGPAMKAAPPQAQE